MHFLSAWRRAATLRITAPESPAPRAFEALLILGNAAPHAERVCAQTPFARELPDVDSTIVVRPTDGEPSLNVEYEIVRRGRVVLRGRSWRPVAVIQRRRGHVLAGGLDDTQRVR